MNLPSQVLPAIDTLPILPVENIDSAAIQIELPCDGRAISEFASDLGGVLSDTPMFLRGDMPVRLKDSKLHSISADEFITLVENHVEIGAFRSTKEGQRYFARKSMRGDIARTVLASQQFLTQLRPLKRLNPIPLPVMRQSGKIELLRPGYDVESQTFTAQGNVVINENMPPEEATGIIDELTREFPFNDDGRSQAVVVSAMMNFFCLGLLNAGAIRPVFIFSANAEGAGKTTLAMVCVVPVLGMMPTSSLPKSDEELRKSLDSAVMEGAFVFVLDNTRDTLRSSVLEAFTTASTWSGRVLGASRTFTCENNVTVLVTANGATISADLRRRSLIADLFVSDERPELREFRTPLTASVLLQQRPRVLSALWSMVRSWDEAGRPPATCYNASFPEWGQIIGGIVEHAGYNCPMEVTTVDSAADTESADMAKLAFHMGTQRHNIPLVFNDVATLAIYNGLFESILPNDPIFLERAETAKMGKLLAKFNGRKFQQCFLFQVSGSGHARRFMVTDLRKEAGV